jgi:hypothetical protein
MKKRLSNHSSSSSTRMIADAEAFERLGALGGTNRRAALAHFSAGPDRNGAESEGVVTGEAARNLIVIMD